MKMVFSQVTRSLLSVWAVELSLARLNELREAGEDALAASRARLVELLKQCMDLEAREGSYFKARAASEGPNSHSSSLSSSYLI